MIIPAELDTPVILTRVVSGPESGWTARNCGAFPPRLRNDRSAPLVSADPQYAASHPHGCSAISSSTANGMFRHRFAGKYQPVSGTSYSATQFAPAFMTNGSPVTPV